MDGDIFTSESQMEVSLKRMQKVKSFSSHCCDQKDNILYC